MLVAVTAALTFVMLAVMISIPSPYAIQMPGPTVDTLSDVEGEPMIRIGGVDVFDSSGELRLTTVSVAGGPGFPVTVGDVVTGWLSTSTSVVPVEAVYDTDATREEVQQQSQAQMTSSQETAINAALRSLGYDVPTELVVFQVVEGSGSVGVVEAQDVVVSITDPSGALVETATFSDLTGVLASTPVGSEVQLGVLREGEPLTLTVTTGDDGQGGSLLGLLIDPQFEFPVDVEIRIQDIGGPSAGTMFALGIIESLTPGDTTSGAVIAGTGTMSLESEVGAIGGIVQKMNGALRDGAEYFLAPESNCAEVIGNVPQGLTVVSVATLDEAWAAVESIGQGETSNLPQCTVASAD